MSLFSRAVAGAAEAGSKIINRYIDEDLLRSRAQVLADIQRTSAVQTDRDLSAARLDPTRVAAERGVAVDNERAIGTVRNEVALAGKRAEATDAGITEGLVGRAKATAQAGADVQFDAQKRALTELGGLEVKLAGDKARATAEATYSTQAKYREKPKADLTPAEKLGQIEVAIGRPLKQEEKEALAGLGKTGTDPLKKVVDDALTKALETGTIQPEQAAEYAGKIRQGFTNAAITAQMGPVVAKARQGKDIDSLVKELTDQGFSTDQMRGFGITEQELKGTSTKKPGKAGEPEAARDPNTLMGKAAGIVDRMGQMGVDYTSPQGKAALQARVAEAKGGGTPLNDTEKLRAQQAGLL